jgi:hypothetical protein
MGMILLIEDNGATARDTVDVLNGLEYEIKCAYSYSSAIKTWGKYNGIFDCIILDLHIDPSGLDPKRNHYYPLVGMAFLDDICDGKTEEEKKNIWEKTIIFSGYINILEDKAHEFGWPLSQLKLIPKDTFGISSLLKTINQIII